MYVGCLKKQYKLRMDETRILVLEVFNLSLPICNHVFLQLQAPLLRPSKLRCSGPLQPENY